MKAYKKVLLITLSILYSIIFWNEKLGLNLFLFSVILLIILFYENKDSFKTSPVKFTVFGTLLSGLMVVLFNSFIAKFSHIVSFWIMIAFMQQGRLRSVYYAAQYTALNYFKAPRNIFEDFASTQKSKSKTGIFFYNLKLVFIPLIILLVFYILFYNANPRFADLASRFWTKFFHIFDYVLAYVSFSRLLLILAGALITGGILYRSQLPESLDDSGMPDELQRKRAIRRGRVFNPVNALKKEYKTAVLLVMLLNGLLVVVNVIDISWIWINFTIPKGMVLKHFVHEGTYLLILSILLSIGIILYYFRNNINFYPGNGLLKVLSYTWMAQNIVLTVSVYLRNYHYINYHGLAYKRIGVIIFLILTVAGLVSMIMKIARVKSSYFVIKQNLWAGYAMMLIMTLIDWDVLIAKFNLSHWNKAGVDVSFYFTVSPKVIPYLYESLPVISEQIKACNNAGTNYTAFNNISEFKRELNQNKLNYLRDQMNYSWLSWNLSDYRTIKTFPQ